MTSLSLVLRLNALSCLGFGALFVLWPTAVSAVLGSMPPVVLVGLGAVLMGNGLHLVVSSFRRKAIPAEILWFSIGDLIWWLATLALIAFDLWVTTALGIVLALAVAVAVAAMGVTQLFLLGIERSGLTPGAHWRQIGRSWLALPRWVKFWLFALNIVFLLSPVFLPLWAATVVLISYVASGPLLLAFAVHDGGLSRVMGIGHLVPWLPMLAWLMVVAMPALTATSLAYLWLLIAMTAICLALDVYDLGRWARGDRVIMGQPA